MKPGKVQRVDLGGEDGVEREVGRVVPLRVIALVVAILLYGGAQVISRTEGFCALVAEQLGRRLQIPMSLERCGLTWDLDFFFSGAKSEAREGEGAAGFAIGSGRVSWSWPGWGRNRARWVRRVELEHWRLELQRTREGVWKPAAFLPVAEWVAKWGRFQGLAGFGIENGEEGAAAGRVNGRQGEPAAWGSGKNRFAWEGVEVVLRDGRIVWWDADGRRLGEADGVELVATPLRTAVRRMNHLWGRVERARAAPGWRVRDLRFEVLAAGERQVVLGFKGDWRVGEVDTELVEEPVPVPEESPEPGFEPDGFGGVARPSGGR